MVWAVTEAAQLEAEKAGRYVESVAAHLAQAGMPAETTVMDAWPADAILTCVQGEDLGLIVMSTHGRSGLRRLVMGNVAEKMLYRYPMPVLLVRGEALHPESTSGEPAESTRDVRLGGRD
ncbi:MAG: hypothetical protein C4290_00100 [Chloroflexota bacterium]